MSTSISIVTEEDPAFIVRVFAARFKRSLKIDKKARQLASLKGTFALKFKDGQALTISAQKTIQNSKKVTLKRGVDLKSSLVIHLDADRPELKPKITGLYRHLILAIKVGKLLDDSELSWIHAAEDFWEFAHKDSQFPKAIKILASDEGNILELGEGKAELEMEGSSKILVDLFSGSTLLLQEVFRGRIKINSTMKPLTEFSRVNLEYMLDFR